jgi:phosphoribosylformylglycinamidine synthase
VTGGNVSLYNENPAGAIYPTPVVGMIGVLEDVARHTGSRFRAKGDVIVLLGRNTDELGGSEYLKVVHGVIAGDAPAIDLEAERALQEAVLEMNAAGLLCSAHDCAEGGLAVCLAEAAIGDEGDPFGIAVRLEDELESAPLLFGEAQGRIVVSCADNDRDAVLAVAGRHGVPAVAIGVVTGEAGAGGARFDARTRSVTIDLPVAEVALAWRMAIPRLMDKAHG